MEDKTIVTSTDKTVSPPDAPAIEGLIFRHFRGDEDYPGILHVNNASKIADGLDHDLHTLESIKHTYGSTANHDPHEDMLIAAVNGEMVAYNRVYLERQLDGDFVYWHSGFVVPEWRGKGIGHAMIHWAEGRAGEIDAGQQGEGMSYIEAIAYNSMAGLENLLKTGGYEPVRYEFSMRTSDLDHIPDVPMPEGLEVRPVKPEQYRAV